ncbi:MAG: glycosyltransferase family 2 protein [Thermoleophilia bacterium]
MMKDNARVSIVIPMRNEESHIGRCLDSVMDQDYPADRLEVKVVDGRSDDQSAAIVRRYAGRTPDVELLDNPGRITPVALNIGIRNSSGDIVIILGSHSFVEPDFVSRNIAALSATGADCVGGKIETVSDTSMGRVISQAMSSTFGVGNSRFRTSLEPGFVGTVAFGAYRREVFERIGIFDEELIRNQDDEFNFRLIKSGGTIFLDPSIRSSYFSRATLRGLWKQYFQYGWWKTMILRKHGRVPAPRNLAPAAALIVFGLSLVLAMVVPSLIWIAAIMLTAYLVISFVIALRFVSVAGPFMLLLPFAYVTLHLSYAAGFICGLPNLAAIKGKRECAKKKG